MLVQGNLFHRVFPGKYRGNLIFFLPFRAKTVLQSSDQISAEENIFFTMGIDESYNAEKYGPILRIGYLDMILRNAFYVDDEIQWFDQEWILECVPAKYILFRTIAELYTSFPWLETVITLMELANSYQLFLAWEDFRKMQQLCADQAPESRHNRCP